MPVTCNNEVHHVMDSVEESWASNCKIKNYTKDQELQAQAEYFHGAKVVLRSVFSLADPVLLRRWDYFLSPGILIREPNANPNGHTC